MSIEKKILCVLFILFFAVQFLSVNLFSAELSAKQKVLSVKYAQLEQALSRMSMATAKSDPKRAALLEKVLLLSKEKLVGNRLENIVVLLESKRLGDSALGQKEVEKDIAELLQLLESDDKKDTNTLKREQLQKLIKELTELYNQQRINAQKTASQDKENLDAVTKEQEKLRQKTEELRKNLNEQDGNGNNNSNNSPESENAENNESENSEKNKSDAQNSNKNESGDASENKENQDENESESETESESAEDSPQNDLKKANKHQRQAKKNLQEKKKNDAHSDMDAAAAEIIKAKEKLMKMLRQLREEELMQTLEKLGGRFKRMLQMERAIRSQTEELGNEFKLAGTDGGEIRQIKVKASKSANEQGIVIDDADAALILLREDGTAQAMLESLLQVRFDAGEAKARLERSEVDDVTLEIEDSVITSLQEMIEAIEKAIEESKERQEEMKKQPPNQSAQNNEKEEPLIQLLSELKMIKSMQTRINERTNRYEKLTTKKLKEEQNPNLEHIQKNVEELARQQNRIAKILHDIKVGKIEKK
ncbi:MAG: hypothetical protein LBK06_03170 [Planctomycetaceae bacterium]|jgi:hypothetical protein|nr:hypothetical protein [Planctomycetaceae bacterium]